MRRLTLESPVKLAAERTARRAAQTDSGSIDAVLEADFMAALNSQPPKREGATGKESLIFLRPDRRSSSSSEIQ
jgi:hypothetical protein